jgi:hypothetical protein
MADYIGTSVGPDGHRISEMWGGTGNGSWINTKLPPNTAVHPNSQVMVDDIVQNVYGKITGSTANAWAAFNTTLFTATINVIPLTQPRVPVYIQGVQAGPEDTWAMARNAMAQVGIPIPDGVEPTIDPRTGTADRDGTVVLWQPDYVWPNRSSDLQYFGRYYELWGAVSPAQNAALGKPAVWTAKQPGRMLGVKTFKHAHGRNRFGNDVTGPTSSPQYVAPASVVDPSPGNTYPGYGYDGVAEEYTMPVTASKIPFSHSLITMRDMARTDPETGRPHYIDHPLLFMMAPAPSTMRGTKVWPAQNYDVSSRSFMPHGTRLRLPANITMDPAWSDLKYAIVKAMRDYGIIFGDTAGSGSGVTFRVEPGASAYTTGGFSNATMKSLPWSQLVALPVGSDAEYNILDTGTPPPSVVMTAQLWNNTTDTAVRNIANGNAINVTEIPAAAAIRITPSGSVASITSILDGATASDSTSPYTREGLTLGVGNHTLILQAYNNVPALIGTTTISFTVYEDPPEEEPPPPGGIRPGRGRFRGL